MTTLSLLKILSRYHNFADIKKGSLQQLANLIDNSWTYAEKSGMTDREIEEWLIEVLNK